MIRVAFPLRSLERLVRRTRLARTLLLVAMLGAVVVFAEGPRAQAQEQPPNIKAIVAPAPEEKTDSSLQMYFKVKVVDAATGQLRPERYEVYVTPEDEKGLQREIFPMLPRDATYHDEPPGIYGGLVYFPHGGHWKVNATVNKYISEIDKIKNKDLRTAPPVTYARATVEVDVVGGALASVGREAFFGKDARSRPTWNAIPIAMLWIHSLGATAWGAIVAIFLVLAIPAGRRSLSERGCNFFDQRFGLLVRTYWWVTALVIGTGIYNLFKNVVYRTPFTPAKASQIFRLPYGKPYFLALFVKLAMYAVMIILAIPVVREARRRADLMGSSLTLPADGSAAAAHASAGQDDDPWSGVGAGTSRHSRPGGRGGTTAASVSPAAVSREQGAVATMSVETEAVATDARVDGNRDVHIAEDEEARLTMKVALAVFALGVPVLFLCVTIIKDLHNLAETIRYWTYWTSGS
jgi:hypothetical protein